MSSTTSVLSVDQLSKRYILGGPDQLNTSFREMLMSTLSAPFKRYRNLSGDVDESQLFWALEDINFKVNQGEVVGIIGKNGAGKSTLLKILSRITTPTHGSVTIRGNVASLLEVGTGFHPELTGRENIYLNGAILGMRRKEITSKFDKIVGFANIEKFVDTPVKRYSSGMYVRLAFSIAAHLEPEILIVDEVLAVGDIEFQKRCLGKLSDIATQGRTVLFVSHNMSAINRLCSRGILLENGKLKVDGAVTDVIRDYLQDDQAFSKGLWTNKNLNEEAEVNVERIEILNEKNQTTTLFNFNEQIEVKIEYRTSLSRAEFVMGVALADAQGNDLFSSFDTDDETLRDYSPTLSNSISCNIPANLFKPGAYTMTVFSHKHQGFGLKTVFLVRLNIEINNVGALAAHSRLGILQPILKWQANTRP